MKPALALVAVALIAATACRDSAPASSNAPIVFAASRGPTLSGEIYRIDPHGHRVDLSNSPFQDTDPAVSPDGKRVAFFSDRLGGTSVYEVGIDGRHLTLAGRFPGRLYEPPSGFIYWQPHGDHLAVGVSILQPSHRRIDVASDSGAFATNSGSPWSPDGKILAIWTGKKVRGVGPNGRVLWAIAAHRSFVDAPSGAWSTKGLLALDIGGGVSVYDERGNRLSRFARASSPVWSPNGALLAFTVGKSTVVVTAQGHRVLSARTSAFGEQWIDNRRLVFFTSPRCKFLDARTGAFTNGDCGNWADPLRSADGKRVIVLPRKGSVFTLGVAPAAGGRVTPYTHVPGCSSGNGGVEWTPAPDSLQFAGRSDSIVYENWGWQSCSGKPLGDLYEIQPDGSGLTRLTHGAGATQPSVSPDGTEIAYALVDGQACAQKILLVSSSGTPLQAHSAWDDEVDSPTWSPDGKTILYSGWYACGGANHGKLFTVPAAGGRTTSLRISSPHFDLQPAWGPTRVAFIGPHGLTTAKPDGSDPVVVAQHGADPAWSRNGQLAYLIGTSLAVGTADAVKLPFATVESLQWTPDGTRLVVAARKRRDADLDLYSLKPDGSDVVRLTKNFGVIR